MTKTRRSSVAGCPRRAIPQHRPIVARRGAECFLVATAEMAKIGKAAGERDLRDTVVRAQRIGEIAPALFQPTPPDPIADRRALGVKQILQIARRYANPL